MLTAKRGDEGSPDIERWANEIAKSTNGVVRVEVYYDGDSSTYVLRLMKASRALLFRLSEAQVGTEGREAECERTLKRKFKDLDNMI
jgi:hypothetical protein